ncbi:aminotransferase class V-fold PLP-dependent enzyme [Paracrocinitomix mangrovi]|uniref:aminotransferase class V-fold PLP-dependent enzyme n=1 Tax=Paracrocinitomix mangrovi TaxID=2862509 RepID=UPI001C8D5E23|nr:aminotransferase class V-fold PLP-dependent enzyme [Paracrocinitomix mangrovi]UKN00512.1 aminotransferase class V-fold PLP-dependent enzyme [Paracrocinitomix mangrovi]
MKSIFTLREDIHYLNHGSFGAVPKVVFETYQNFQKELAAEPLQFMIKNGPAHMEVSKKALADYINCDYTDLVYVTNPTTAINIVARSLKLNEGDEILTTNHEYGAMDRTWNYYCRKVGAKYVQQEIPIPIQSKEDFLQHFWKGLTTNTKVIFISQITSATALIFPVKEICDRARELGILTIVDGAHVPAHIPLDIKELNADIYTGACHKWMMSPLGSSFLHVKKEHQTWIDPLIISWGYEAQFPSESQFQDYHQMQGTRDFSAFLTTPACLQFIKENDWETKTAEAKKILHNYYPIVAKEIDSKPIAPLENEFLGQIVSIPIRTPNAQELKGILYNQYKIEIPVFDNMGPGKFLRISYQPYNTEDDMNALIDALRKIKTSTSLIQ